MTQENDNTQHENRGPSLFSRLRKWTARLAIAGLLFSNFATLVNATVHDFLYSGVESVVEVFGGKNYLSKSPTSVKKRKFNKISTKAKKISAKVSRRLATSISLNLEALPAIAIPPIGIPIAIAVVGAEIYLACKTMNDINSLLLDLEVGKESDRVCGKKIPTRDEVVEGSKKGVGEIVKTIQNIGRKMRNNASNNVDAIVTSWRTRILAGLRKLGALTQ